MKQPESLDMVAQFHNTFKHPILNTPTIPNSKRCELRVSLIAEELDELREAIEDKDMVEIADALCDIQYVLSGAVLEFGLAHKFNTLFSEVQRSNMSKACKSEEEAQKTVDYFLKEKGDECYYKKEDGLYLVYRKLDNKTMKSINYSPANLKEILK